jgi:acetyltransferase-like isoleucine patch superfamily enzyme
MAQAVRERGVKVGDRCHIFTDPANFSTEPYLIELGDDVAIAAGVIFATHDGLVWTMRNANPDMQVFGRIKVGSGSLISTNAFILPGTEIGVNCIIGAGSVVGGRIPDNSLVYGNPARVLKGKAGLVRTRLMRHPHRMNTLRLPPEERHRQIKNHFGIL